MIDRRAWLAPAAIGGYAAAVASLPTAALRGAALLPPVLAAGAWWLLADARRWVLVFLCAALTLPPLPVRLGDSGPHVALAVAAAGALAGVLHARDWGGSGHWLDLALPAHVAALLLSLAPAAIYSGPEIAAASLARVILFSIAVYVYFYTAHGPGAPDRLDLVFYAACASAAFACVDFYFQFPAPAGFGAQYVWLSSGVLRRAQGVFYEASTLGNLCASFLVMIAVCLARPSESPVRRPVLLAGGAMLFAAMMLSFSRASVVNLAVSLAALVWMERRRIAWLRAAAGAAAAAVAGATALYFAAPRMLEFYLMRLEWSARFLIEGGTGVWSGRIESWTYLLRFLAAHPWHALLGVGYKTLPYSDFTGRPVVADNAYLSALVETGILGLAAMLASSLAVIVLAWRAARSAHPKAGLYGAWIGCFWAGQMAQMFSGDLLTYWRVLPVYFWALGMAVRHTREE